MGNHQEFIAVVPMRLHKIIEQRPFQLGANAFVDPEAVSGELGAPLVVDQSQIGTQLHMILGRKIKMVGFSVVAQRHIVFLASRQKIPVGKIGQRQHQRIVFLFNRFQFRFVCLHGVGQFLKSGEDRCHIPALFFVLRDHFAFFVLLGLQLFAFADQLSAPGIQLQNSVDLFSCFFALVV